MARRATVVKLLAAQNPYNLVLDAGNLLSAKTEDIKVESMIEASARMGYNLLGAGINELSNGMDRIGIPADRFRIPYVATNLANADHGPAW